MLLSSIFSNLVFFPNLYSQINTILTFFSFTSCSQFLFSYINNFKNRLLNFYIFHFFWNFLLLLRLLWFLFTIFLFC
uniref:Uncharacterized protein n=1 Tax=Panstrongylus lignarius TaxID=156445 RepID=A0A224XTA7_9HEMI